MGRKIHVVNLNGFQATTPSSEGQAPNEAEQMSKMKEEVENEPPATEQPAEPTPTEPAPIEEPKAKSKRKPPSKPKENKQEEINEEVREEIIAPQLPPKEETEVKQSDKKIKTVELVSCPDCKKEMSKKTLRYSHEKNCTGKPIVREEIPVKRRPLVKESKPKEVIEQYISIPEEIIQQELNKRVKEQKESRVRAKEEKIKKLAMQIV
jgi:hypothetical protein